MSLLARMTLIYESKYFTIILIISISTLFHLYNVTGFPTIHIDEGTYMYRAMHFLTLGNVGWNVSFYDHPYFGPVLLGILLKVVNYPLLVLSDTQFQGLANNPYLIPRLMMGLFAIIDTFLVYAISKRLYDRNVAILSAVLFSVMPFTWALRRIYLESLLLPFFLGSVLLVLYSNYQNQSNRKNTWLLISVSGILFGLSVFTKAPIFLMIPLLIYLIYKQNKELTYIIIFMIPVIVISTIWPLDALIKGEFEQWTLGVSSQMMRHDAAMLDAIYNILEIDPTIFSIGIAGILFAIIKRDYFILLGIIPFLAFFSILIDYINWFYMIPIFGFVCISSSVLIIRIISSFSKFKLFTVSIIGLVITFGFLSTLLLILTDVGSFQDQTISYINAILSNGDINFDLGLEDPFKQKNAEPISDLGNSQRERNNLRDSNINKLKTTMIASPIYSWIYKYIYSYNETSYSYTEDKEFRNDTKLILVLDRYFRDFLANNVESKNRTWNQDIASADRIYEVMKRLNSSKYFVGNGREFNFNQYPYSSMRFNLGGSPIEVRTNF